MNDSQYVTKKEFYTAAVVILVLIWGTILAAEIEGFIRYYLFFVTIGLQLYYCYKLIKIRRNSKQNE